MVIVARRGEARGNELDLWLHKAGVEISGRCRSCRSARHAWRLFGKGRHPARLNFADCLSYALAKR